MKKIIGGAATIVVLVGWVGVTQAIPYGPDWCVNCMSSGSGGGNSGGFSGLMGRLLSGALGIQPAPGPIGVGPGIAERVSSSGTSSFRARRLLEESEPGWPFVWGAGNMVPAGLRMPSATNVPPPPPGMVYVKAGARGTVYSENSNVSAASDREYKDTLEALIRGSVWNTKPWAPVGKPENGYPYPQGPLGSGAGSGTCCVPQGNTLPEGCRINTCRCLSFASVIATPIGDVSVMSLKVGDIVWTQDATGNRIVRALEQVSHVPALNHRVVHLVLADGRSLDVSGPHPAANGKTVGELKVGDAYDGSVVRSVEVKPYEGSATYDILPAGKTGFYWANGILMGSTLK